MSEPSERQVAESFEAIYRHVDAAESAFFKSVSSEMASDISHLFWSRDDYVSDDLPPDDENYYARPSDVAEEAMRAGLVDFLVKVESAGFVALSSATARVLASDVPDNEAHFAFLEAPLMQAISDSGLLKGCSEAVVSDMGDIFADQDMTDEDEDATSPEEEAAQSAEWFLVDSLRRLVVAGVLSSCVEATADVNVAPEAVAPPAP